MIQYIVIAVLASLIIWAAIRTARKAKRGGGCCGEHEAVSRVSVADRRRSNYPHQALLTIGGMTCENCARRVENALNQLEGIWATVSISSHQAKVLCKQPPDEEQLRRAVQQAGYVVTAFSQKK